MSDGVEARTSPGLVVASREQLEAISRESYQVWGGGLSLGDYRGLWEEIGRTTWARKHARHYAWQDANGRVLSSMKVYRPRMRIGGVEGRGIVIGAVFTPRAMRRRRYATVMVESSVRVLRRPSDLAALLFSDIGTQFYSRLGFFPLPATETIGRLPLTLPDAAARVTFRSALRTDLGRFREAHRASSARRQLAILRDDEHWKYLWVRARSFFARVRDPSVGQHWRIAERNGEFLGYLITVEGRGEWNVREVGAVDGDPHTSAEILTAGAARARQAGLRRFYGWLPDDVLALLEGWPIDTRPRRRALPMIRAVDVRVALAITDGGATTHVPFQDQF